VIQSYFSEDISEFLLLLQQYDVKYVIVGGEAVIYHGHARLTGDIDIFYEPDSFNAKKLYNSLSDFWGGRIPGIEGYEDLIGEDMILQFGIPPNRLDLMNSITGVQFEECWNNRVTEFYQVKDKKIKVYYIGKEELKINKSATNRPRDRDDLNYLQ
jgi:hypothetical protein